MGYNSTTSALCEHVDNAIQWGATEVRVYFRQTGKRGAYETDVLVLDNGTGMAPNISLVRHVLRRFDGVRQSFGHRALRDGHENGGAQQCPVMDLYSWQEPGAYYNMTLDVEAIGKERANLIELPDRL